MSMLERLGMSEICWLSPSLKRQRVAQSTVDSITATQLYGAAEVTVDKLQRAQNNAARAVLSANGRADARPLGLLRQLHWLPVP